jgi:GntR family transcriptional regulator
MLLTIEPDSPVPIFEQIVAGITYAVASEILEPGMLIPSVRELSQKLLVNPNTVARAYQELERAGVLQVLRGRGMEVTASATQWCKQRRQEMVRGLIRHALRDAIASALPVGEVRRLVDEEFARANGHRAGREGKI